jgi:Domain of unknown function (DUF5658)
MFRSLPSVAAASLLAIVVSTTPAAAQDLVAANTLTTTVLFPASLLPAVTPAVSAVAASAEAVPTPRVMRAPIGIDQNRPTLLPALYVAQGALQAMDAHSTYSAIGRGAHEANPLMQGVVRNKSAMLAVKAGVAASTIWMAESMWRRGNRMGAIATMIAANAVTAVVVAHNYQLANRLQ